LIPSDGFGALVPFKIVLLGAIAIRPAVCGLDTLALVAAKVGGITIALTNIDVTTRQYPREVFFIFSTLQLRLDTNWKSLSWSFSLDNQESPDIPSEISHALPTSRARV
jgi:hypothetical protein